MSLETELPVNVSMLAGSMDGVNFEAIARENHTATMAISKNPIAYGANITDHSYRENLKLSLDVHVSKNPINDYNDTTHGAKGENRPGNFYQKIVAWQSSGTLVDIQTSLLLYQQMAILSCSAPVEVDDDNNVTFTIELEQPKIVNNQTVVYGKQKTAAKSHTKKASNKNNKGQKVPNKQVEQTSNNYAWVDSQLARAKQYQNNLGFKF